MMELSGVGMTHAARTVAECVRYVVKSSERRDGAPRLEFLRGPSSEAPKRTLASGPKGGDGPFRTKCLPAS